ncbi:MAG TPA: tetratricopeptide repeat protein [Candidatus Polarisedimenticolaceae bacterium]|nr:tetratricopeptide repeat protein [Candidatus Polarisedimenticolaceae bacterium]
MRRLTLLLALAAAPMAGCAQKHRPVSPSGTLATLHDVRPDLEEAQVEGGLDQAMEGYRRFLADTPETAMTPEAMRRLADLQLEKRFGIHTGESKPREMAAPESAPLQASVPDPAPAGGPRESDQDFERRTTSETGTLLASNWTAMPGDALGTDANASGPLEAIALYDRLLTEYPQYEHSDQVLYQKARAYDELGRTEEAMATMEQLVRVSPHSGHLDEVQFRRGEYFFMRRKYREAEDAYGSILKLGTASEYHELALYKLGWTFYKQDMYEEALQNYLALLDYKVSIGYDFDESHAEEDERRVTDTFRVISLSFSNLGGPEAVRDCFSRSGARGYEDRIYANLGEHYLAKLRYDDAAKTYRAFETLYPFHKASPRFAMKVVETFTQGGFPKLVLESKREFAARYGLQAEYWRHFKPEESPEVLDYLKANLKDLATHYHAQYQGSDKPDEKLAHYREALRWYGDYLTSFPQEVDSAPINYRMADLLLENKDFGEAARQYARTAYDYPAHEQSAAAGYAAVYAYREQLKVAPEDQREPVKRDTVAASLRFADAFPEHQAAPAILGAAADDLYEMKDYPPAVATAQRLLTTYAAAEPGIRRSAWIVVGHGSFELAQYPQAEEGYTQVLRLTAEDDASHAALVDNLAASIYKQGELAKQAQDYRAAADHFLRIRTAAPTSTIRPTAEFDAGAALMTLKDWTAAASVLEGFRAAYPEHELRREATRQIALAYRESNQLMHAADEYDRLAGESDDPAVRSEALLTAGDLYAQSSAPERALDLYRRYVEAFPSPLEPALETRGKIAEIHKTRHEDALYRQELQDIVRADGEAGAARTARTRTLAGRAALVLVEPLYQQCVDVKLRQPFEESLQEKKKRMDAVIDAMDGLVEYEIADVTAAATFYMAETYLDFSRSLTGSERPADLDPGDEAEYAEALETEAFPFEEKAIDFHEKNLEMLHAGVFNPWTEKSLEKLVELAPGRYARSESSSGFLNAMDTYVYRSPVAQLSPLTLGDGPVVDDADPK